MITHVIQYLIESTLYLFVFLMIYRLFLAKLTHFTWMRVFLLGGLVLGLILPLITLPMSWYRLLPGAGSIDHPIRIPLLNEVSGQSQQQQRISASGKLLKHRGFIRGSIILVAYISGVIYRFVRLSRMLIGIRSSIRKYPKEKKGKYWFIQADSTSPAFSFFNFIFLGRQLSGMNTQQMAQIENHEIIHARHFHTLDILLVELISALFWFNPLIHFFKRYLREVHEFTADQNNLIDIEMKRTYSCLLLRLATDEHAPQLSSGFSARQIRRRIRMLEKSRSHPRHRLLFLLLLPVSVFLLMSFSYLENRSRTSVLKGGTVANASPAASQVKVGHITWVNNTVYTDAQLDKKLGVASGEEYSQDRLNHRLWLDEDAVCSLYLDNGYLFFNAESEESTGNEGTVDLTITIYEGIQVKVRDIIIKGNGNVPEEEIMEKILNRPGELFSRIKIIRSVRAIALMDQFDPEHIEVIPTPIQDPDTGASAGVDIEFRLSEN